MSTPFLVSYVGLWLVVIGESIMLFALLREVGKWYLSQSPSFQRDGPAIGDPLPPVTLQTPEGRLSLDRLPSNDYSLFLVASDQCSICPTAAEIVQKWVTRTRNLSGAVLLNAERFTAWRVDGDLTVGLVSQNDVSELGVRAVPFLFVTDSSGRVLAKGLLNNHGHMKAMLKQARRTQPAVMPSTSGEVAGPSRWRARRPRNDDPAKRNTSAYKGRDYG